ncbi:hypothetical protein [Dysosmobacter sp.]|uniref:hypothetical protein n=1 Tax=Dysosmobacter sp. TaxID=2591382 RepID=UPI002D7E729A|nr:hypothetical protein [Dysosmobacter sp.]
MIAVLSVLNDGVPGCLAALATGRRFRCALRHSARELSAGICNLIRQGGVSSRLLGRKALSGKTTGQRPGEFQNQEFHGRKSGKTALLNLLFSRAALLASL